jgi:pimeloyl-ACP methyl ester carboxylesterase
MAWSSETLDRGIHAFTGGEGSTVVLLSGWPETAEAYREVFPPLAASHRVICMDPPGLGDSAASDAGYDTATVSRILEDSHRSRTQQSFHLVGHDLGAWIAYAWAAQFPERVRSLTVMEGGVPGLNPPQNFPLSFDWNVKLWQFSFNNLPELPEILTQGRERELFDWLFRHKAQHPERISPANRDRYVTCYGKPGGMSRGFAYYRAAAVSASQNLEFSKQKLRMPVLALGGSAGMADDLRKLLQPVATDLEGGAIEDCGHFVLEEQPQVLAQRLLTFFSRVETAAATRSSAVHFHPTTLEVKSSKK